MAVGLIFASHAGMPETPVRAQFAGHDHTSLVGRSTQPTGPGQSAIASTLPSSGGSEREAAGLLLAFGWKEGLGGDYRWRLDRKGVRVNVYINDQFQSVVKGGSDVNGSGRNAASMDAFVTLDLHRLGLWENADALLHLQSNWGRGVNLRVGSLAEVNDDADGSLGLHVAQLWYRHHVFDQKAALMLGFLDFQTIVDRNVFANSEDKQFWNQALDNNPLVPLNIGLGAALEIQATSWWTLNLGAGDAQSELYETGFTSAFHNEAWFIAYAENTLRVRWSSRRGPLAGNYRAGVIYDPRPRDIFRRSEHDTAKQGDDYGLYVSVDQKLFRETTEDEQGLGVFARFADRTSETFRFSRFWSGGFSYAGLIPGRNKDVLGFGIAVQRAGDIYRSRINREVDSEAVYELYYAVQLTDWLVVTPDIQYIDNPGGSGGLGHAVAAGVRIRASF